MRNLLKRRPSADPKPPLRERLRAAKAKAGRVLAVNRILLKPEPTPTPAIDRPLLTNYSTFLKLERDRVCAELYPHKGTKAAQFTLGLNAAWEFFHTNRSERDPRSDLAPASSRAARVLDVVGVDWRADRFQPGTPIWDNAGMHDDGERPRLPHGWPALDADLVEALGDLRRLDLAIEALGTYGPDDDRNLDELPAWAGLETCRTDALRRLAKGRAETLTGLQAKARAVLTKSVQDSGYSPEGECHADDIASSLARDLLGLPQRAIEPRPDPILAAIEEAKRLYAEWDAVLKAPPPSSRSDGAKADAESDRRSGVFHGFIEGTLLKTVPRTGAGCAALARYCGEVYAAHGFTLDENEHADAHLRVLDLIARSPLL